MRSGFTLVELSIVLVIIGLIAGAIMVGRDMIHAAGVRSTISQIERYHAATNTFKAKYNALPGDISEPNASGFGFKPRGHYAGEGDGNGILEGVLSDAPGQNAYYWQGAGETVMFWVDLSTAGLIEGNFTAASPTTPVNPPGGSQNVSGPGLSLFFPPTRAGNASSIYAYSRGGQNYFGLATILYLSYNQYINTNPGLTPIDAYAIDQKLDDGYPQTGTVVARMLDGMAANYGPDGGGPASSGPVDQRATPVTSVTCFDNDDVDQTRQHYSVGKLGGENLNCALSFRFQ